MKAVCRILCRYAGTALTSITAIGAIAAAIFTGWQAWIAQDTEHRQLRAYLIVKSATFAKDDTGRFKIWKTFPDGRSALMIYYDVSNEGSTPAYDVFRRITVEFPYDGQKIEFGYTDGTAAYVSRDQTFGPVITRPFTNTEIDAISSGSGNPFIFAGQITYRDIFGNMWPTNFCFMYAAVAQADVVSFVSCPRWSDTDQLNYAR